MDQIATIAAGLGAPLDRPRFRQVLGAFAAAVEELAPEFPAVRNLSSKLLSFAPLADLATAKGGAADPMSKRRGRHLVYALYLELVLRLAEGQPIDRLGMRILAAWSTRSIVTGWAPDPEAVAKVRAILVRPESSAAMAWSARGRERCFRLALSALQQTLEMNPSAAGSFDIAVVAATPMTNDPIEQFNRLFCKRLNALRTSSDRRAAAAAGGHGTLTAAGLGDAGQKLLNAVMAGDAGSLRHYLRVMTHLSEQVVDKLPVLYGAGDHPMALAWVSLHDGTYCYRLFNLLKRGAKRSDGESVLYERTEQTVRLRLSPPAWDQLRQCALHRAVPAIAVGDLLCRSTVPARSDLFGRRAYRRTARRMQESLPVLLMQQGGNRWPVLLATSSPFLCSLGRESYGCTPLSLIQVEFDRAHGLLRWPASAGVVKECLIGSTIVPTTCTVQSLFAELSRRAERDWRGLSDRQPILASLRAVSPWMSLLEAFCLALRMRLMYRVPRSPIVEGVEAEFDDKHVHPLEPYAVPVPRILRDAARAYDRLIREAIEVLTTSGNPEDAALAQALLQSVAPDAIGLVLQVDPAGRVSPTGYKAWFDEVPEFMRPTGNFARQYWPLQALLLGLPQRLLDVLMRHQLADLHLGAGPSLAVKRNVRKTLTDAVDRQVEVMGLRLPACLARLL